jgi:hypothetical protein
MFEVMLLVPHCPHITAAKDLWHIDSNAAGEVAFAVSKARNKENKRKAEAKTAGQDEKERKGGD